MILKTCWNHRVKISRLATGLFCASIVAACSSAPSSSGPPSVAPTNGPLTAYVTNAEDNGNTPGVGTVIPIDLTNNKPGTPIELGQGAGTNDLIVTSDNKTGYVTNEGTNTVTRITLATGQLGAPIQLPSGSEPVAIAFVPNTNEQWAWTANYGGQTVSTVNLVTGQVGQTISMPYAGPNTVAFTPDGKTCYVANWGTNSTAGSTVTPVQVNDGGAGGKVLPSFNVGLNPNWIAMAHDGKTAYVVNKGGRSVMPVNVATNTPGAAIPLPGLGIEMEISPDGSKAYVAVAGSVDDVVPFDMTTTPITAGSPIKLPKGTQPHWIAFTPYGKTAYVVGNGNSTVTAITVATDQAGSPIKASTDPDSDILAIRVIPALR
jgi:DNA-binding beta-propeller fold protein YncE